MALTFTYKSCKEIKLIKKSKMLMKTFDELISIEIDHLGGGYFHPSMFSDGRLNPKYQQMYSDSGETMFDIDRKAPLYYFLQNRFKFSAYRYGGTGVYITDGYEKSQK